MYSPLLLLAVAAAAFASKCGVSNVRPNLSVGMKVSRPTRSVQTGEAITGSQEATPYSWPWQAIVCETDWFGDCDWKCSATIVSERWAITTASCVAGRKVSDLHIRTGVFHPYSKEKQEMRVAVQAVYIHPSFTPNGVTKQDNIALIETKQAFTFGDYVQAICLPEDDGDLLAANKQGWLTGWGYPKKGGSVSHTLEQAKISFNDNEVCERTWNRQVFDSEICAGDGYKTICNNDEGDPLMVQSPSGKWFMHGNAAMSDADCKLPGIFSKISFFCPWISALTGNDVECIKRD